MPPRSVSRWSAHRLTFPQWWQGMDVMAGRHGRTSWPDSSGGQRDLVVRAGADATDPAPEGAAAAQTLAADEALMEAGAIRAALRAIAPHGWGSAMVAVVPSSAAIRSAKARASGIER